MEATTTTTTIPVPRRSRAKLGTFSVSMLLALGSVAYVVVQLSDSSGDSASSQSVPDAGVSAVPASSYLDEPLAVRFPRPAGPSGDPLVVRFGGVAAAAPTEALVVRFGTGYEPEAPQTEPLVVRFGR